MHYPIKYQFGKELVRVHYNKQVICFHSFSSNHKGVFREFSRRIEATKPQNIHEVIGMARERNISSQAGHIPSVIIM